MPFDRALVIVLAVLPAVTATSTNITSGYAFYNKWQGSTTCNDTAAAEITSIVAKLGYCAVSMDNTSPSSPTKWSEFSLYSSTFRISQSTITYAGYAPFTTLYTDNVCTKGEAPQALADPYPPQCGSPDDGNSYHAGTSLTFVPSDNDHLGVTAR